MEGLSKLDGMADAQEGCEKAKGNGAKGVRAEQLRERLDQAASVRSNIKVPLQEQLQSLINLYTQGQYQDVNVVDKEINFMSTILKIKRILK
mgnify:CR=1 FL=1